MKSLIFSILLIFMTVFLKAQNNVVFQTANSNPSTATTADNYYINGISTREDVGGVEVSRGEHMGYRGNTPVYNLTFTNYNNFPVSVLYELDDSKAGSVTGTIVLKPGESKSSNENYCSPVNFRLIARKMSTEAFSGSSQTLAQNTGSNNSSQIRLGYINMTEFLSTMPDMAIVQKKVEQKTKELSEQLDNMQKRFNTLVTNYQQNLHTGTPEQKQQQEQEITTLQNKIQEFSNNCSQELNNYQHSLVAPVLAKLSGAIARIGASGGYSFIFDSSQGSLLYQGANTTDISQEVRRMLGMNE